MKTNVNKTNVSIKFNSIEEYREIEKKLEEMEYVNDKEWNEDQITEFERYSNLQHFVAIVKNKTFAVFVYESELKTYNNLEEFLND